MTALCWLGAQCTASGLGHGRSPCCVLVVSVVGYWSRQFEALPSNNEDPTADLTNRRVPRHSTNKQCVVEWGASQAPGPCIACMLYGSARSLFHHSLVDPTQPDHRNRPGARRPRITQAQPPPSSRAISLRLPWPRPRHCLLVRRGRVMCLSIRAWVDLFHRYWNRAPGRTGLNPLQRA